MTLVEPSEDRFVVRILLMIFMIVKIVNECYDAELWAGIGLSVLYFITLELSYFWARKDSWITTALVALLWLVPFYDWRSSHYQDIVSALWPPIAVVLIGGRILGWFRFYQELKSRKGSA
ncbi:hypothetical protein OQJ59_11820 [Microbulbifer thermotolerans]|uniref:hypothetical protein n=1 Tax=Microbulbifer thermotolerans TaxID=252514 RepID=UPI00224B1F1E|nr:hypothetical protein [Microbulbifer thermotolerans]MCX2842307.1 hypothetical protein [Microbulbifer thermotolerans]